LAGVERKLKAMEQNKGSRVAYMPGFKVEHLRDDVVGFIPVYTDLGNATDILLKNGDRARDNRSLKSVLKAFARCYALDLKAQRRYLQDQLHRKTGIPIRIGDKRVFIPLKMRRGVTSNDLAHGYIDVTVIAEINLSPENQCKIVLNNGLNIAVLSSRAAVLQSQHLGQKLLETDYNDEDLKEQMILNSARSLGQVMVDIYTLLERIERKLDDYQVSGISEDGKR
jgi:hypothetical protein